MRQIVTKSAKSIEEAKAFAQAFDTLGVRITRIEARGWWRDHTGDTVFCGGGGISIRREALDSARKWVAVSYDREDFRMHMEAPTAHTVETNNAPRIEFYAEF